MEENSERHNISSVCKQNILWKCIENILILDYLPPLQDKSIFLNPITTPQF